ncbi:SRPBCC domain-containing protein [Phenylobacterium sp. LjRoot225]|uniref:SRPBCC domain-containing protein n=1 Tax=Phenylobacterium sp. LjRoot225 TaxID=3342285 RepID=UPI003ED00F2D
MSRARSQAARTIRAPRDRVYQAFLTAEDLAVWLPPGEMTARFHAFDPSPGGGFEMSLFYPADADAGRGKTAADEDRVRVRYLELSPPERIVKAADFVSDDAAFAGEMRMTVTFETRGADTEVAMLFEDLPPGVKPEDNDEGARLSLEKLARHLESPEP